MSQPPGYNRAYSFTDFSSGSPTSQPPGAKLDAEFNHIEATLDATLANLALIQRDDGKLANGSVGTDQLAPTLAAPFVAAAGLVEEISALGIDTIAAVGISGDAAVTTINTAGTTQTAAVNAAGATQVAAVNGAGTTQTSNVNTAGATQLAAITAAGPFVASANTARALSIQATQAAVAMYPRNYARQFAITTALAGGATTANNLITIPPGGTVTVTLVHPKFMSVDRGGAVFNGARYFAVYQTNATVAGMVLAVETQGQTGVHPNLVTMAESVKGLWQATYTGALTADADMTRFKITNGGSGTITILNPFVGLDPYVLHDDREVVAVRNRPEWAPTFGFSDRRYIDRQRRQLAATCTVDGVNGNDTTGSGAPLSPFKTLLKAVTALGTAAYATLAFYRGSVFRETLALADGNNNLQLSLIDNELRGFNLPLPNVTGLDQIPNGSVTNNGDGTYTATVTGTAGYLPVDDGVSSIALVEFDTTIFATQPIKAGRPMSRAADLATVQATPGTVIVANVSAGVWTLRFHPSDSAAPGTRYRYEWTARNEVGSLFIGQSTDGVTLEGLHLSGASTASGPLSVGRNFSGDRLLVGLGPRHVSVAQSGRFTNSIIYGRRGSFADPPIQHVFFTFAVSGDAWEWGHMGLYGADYSAFYSHTSGGSYGYGLAHDGWAVSERTNTTGYLGFAYGCLNQKNPNFVRQYAEGFSSGFTIGVDSGGTGLVDECVIKDCASAFRTEGNSGALIFRNSFARISGSTADPSSGYQSSPQLTLFFNTPTPIVSNNFLHIRPNSPFTSAKNIGGIGNAAYDRNIIVLDAQTDTVSSTYAAISSAAGYPPYTADHQLIVYNGYWGDLGASYPGAPNGPKFDNYLADTGQDSHSLFISLDGDPRGMKAVFLDLENGDSAFAPTALGKMASDYCFANNVGPPRTLRRWPKIMTVDEAALAQRMLG